MWPRRNLAALILTPELVRAIETESSPAVIAWWGVSGSVVSRWRGELGVQDRPKVYSAKSRFMMGSNLRGKPPSASCLAALHARKGLPGHSGVPISEGTRTALAARKGQPAPLLVREALARGRAGPRSEAWKARPGCG